jgi:tRNA threonylcarbamoyladenosine biosynthesis protein TsaB
MYTLAFDTTANGCSIILIKDGITLAKYNEEMAFGQAEVLIPQIKSLLDSHNLQVADLSLMAVCTGPGSFTGVRSGISAARAFGLAVATMKVFGISAFEAYLHDLQIDVIAEINAVIIETKRDDFYYQLFDKHLHKLTEPSAAHIEDILPQLRNKKVSFIGDGVERFLSKPTGLSLHAIRQENCPPIRELAEVAIEKYQNKSGDYPKPLYLRAPDVCIKS